MLDQLRFMSPRSSNSCLVGEQSCKVEARRAIFSIFLGAAIVLLAFGFVSKAARAAGDDVAEKAFKSNCVVCHGADGTGTATGKALKAPDLHSDAAQKLTDAEIAKQISDGKNNMPPFKNTLSKEQISALVSYIRTAFGKKKS
jgi:cytochrome c6